MSGRVNPDLPRSPAGTYNPWLIAAMVSLAPFMEVLDATIANVSLTHMAGSLGASQDESTWILTSYLVSNSIVLPISGWLSAVLGRKRFYQICVAIFTASSVVCAFSTNLAMMLVARVVQGLGGGGLAPVTQSMLADSVPPEKRSQIFAMFGFTVVAAPASGPFIGGWLTDNLSWHWIFLINLPIGLIAMTLIAIFVTEPPLLVKERRELLQGGLNLDYLGLALVAAGFGCLQIFLDKFQEDDGFSSPFILTMCAIAVGSLSLLVVWEWQHPQPVMNFRLFKYRNFAISAVIMFLMAVVLFTSTQMLPQMTQTLMGYNSETAGAALALGGLATISLMPVSGFITGRYVPAKWLMIGAFIELTISMLFLATMTLDVSFNQLSVYRILTVAALPFVFVPVSAVAYIGLPPRLNGQASALMNQMRNIGSSTGLSMAAAILVWRTQLHHARLVEAITPYGSLHDMTASQIAPLVQTQALFMSYIDIFNILAIASALICPIALLLKSPPKRAAQGASVAH